LLSLAVQILFAQSANKQWGSRARCLLDCSFFPYNRTLVGTAQETSGNSEQCRFYHTGAPSPAALALLELSHLFRVQASRWVRRCSPRSTVLTLALSEAQQQPATSAGSRAITTAMS
jgi:hypothetical protein